MAGCSQNSQYMGSQFPGGFPGGFPVGLFPGLCGGPGGLGAMIENFQPFLTSLLADNPQLMEELVKPISAVLVAATADSSPTQNSEKKLEKTEKPEVVLTPNKFQINLNIDGYTPEELSVKTADNFITIEGKHEEKSENSQLSRSFSRRWAIPNGVQGQDIKCNFNLTEGILQLEAQRIDPGQEPEKEKMIPIKIN